jgi:Helix-turn-helix of DDE superfamily endonuclease
VPRCRCPARPSTTWRGIIRRHLKAIGSRWRKLNPGQEALLALAYLRKGETFAELAAGFGVGRTAAWRYVDEVVALAAARAPKLRAPGERECAAQDVERILRKLRCYPWRAGKLAKAIHVLQLSEA